MNALPICFPNSSASKSLLERKLRAIPDSILEQAKQQLVRYAQYNGYPPSWPEDQFSKVLEFVTTGLTEPFVKQKAIQKCVQILRDPRGTGQRLMYPHQVGATWAARVSHWRICFDLVPLGTHTEVVWRKIDRRDKVYGDKGHGK